MSEPVKWATIVNQAKYYPYKEVAKTIINVDKYLYRCEKQIRELTEDNKRLRENKP